MLSKGTRIPVITLLYTGGAVISASLYRSNPEVSASQENVTYWYVFAIPVAGWGADGLRLLITAATATGTEEMKIRGTY